MKLNIPKKLKTIVAKFQEASGELYIVGGASRDMILGREVKDWDFTTNLTPEKMLSMFPKNSFYNNKFGTVSVVSGKKEIYEITTYRSEKGYSDSRHPDKVKWGKSLEEDLKRRDFTINTIALKLKISNEELEVEEIIDPYDGQGDLKKGILKTVGDPDKRFGEDALRLMRAVRISAEIGLAIEDETFKSMVKNAKKINNIAAERIRVELFKILLSDNPAQGIQMMKNTGLLVEIMPELIESIGMEQKGHHIYDVWRHSLESLSNCESQNPVTKLACLLHDVGKPATAVGKGEERTFHGHEVVGSRIAIKIGKRLKLSKKQLSLLFKLVRWHMFTTEEHQTDKAVRRFIKRVTPEYIDEMIALRRSDRLGSGAKETSWRWELFKKRILEVQKQPFTVKDLKVNGEDVMRILKIRPSRKVGEVLSEIFKKVETHPEMNQRDVLLKEIESYK